MPGAPPGNPPSSDDAEKKSKPAALEGRWEFPGSNGESAQDELIREVQEEPDVTLMLGHKLTPSGRDRPISDRLTLRIFLAEIFVGTPRPGESHVRLRWLTADELDSVDWLEADREALAIVAEELSS